MSDDALTVELSGKTGRFSGHGRKLGYPTANFAAKTELPDGIFFGFASLGKYSHHPALIFIGTPTTVGDSDRRVEAYLLDIPDKNYYGLRLKLLICHYHRANQTFESVDKLIKAIQSDEKAGRSWFKKNASAGEAEV